MHGQTVTPGSTIHGRGFLMAICGNSFRPRANRGSKRNRLSRLSVEEELGVRAAKMLISAMCYGPSAPSRYWLTTVA